MKTIIQLVVLVFIFLMTVSSLSAQDQIILKNGDKIDCTIKELSDSEVKYIEIEDANQVIFSINRGQVREIKFSYGKVIEEEPDAFSEAYYVDDHRSNLKLSFLAIASNATILTYERSINPYSSWELSAKFLGLGFSDELNEKGFGLDVAYRIKLKSLSNKNGYRPDHLLHGGYLRAAGGVAVTSEEYSIFNAPSESVNRTLVHMGLDLGKQWIIQNRVSLDLFFGFHYFGRSNDRVTINGIDEFFEDSFNHGDLAGINTIAFATGFRVGILFEKNGGSNKKAKRR